MGKQPFETSISKYQTNLAIVDWLTVTCHGLTVDDVKDLLGMQHIPWDDHLKFMNGYPARLYFGGINILYGADDINLMSDVNKLRDDMGICINMSGTGCRTFETHGRNDWSYLFHTFFTFTNKIREKKGRRFSYNITRLDLAYDDHIGSFDLPLISDHIKERHYLSPSKYSQIEWSDNQDDDIQGLTVYVGSASSDIRFRFYDKAAERGFKDRHWVRLEMQLRDDRATKAAHELLCNDVGNVLRGICSHYLTFVEESNDSNKSRWPVSSWWSAFLDNVASIRLFESPGSEYNLAKSEYYLLRQYGQLMATFDAIYDAAYIINRVRSIYPVSDLDPKYKKLIEAAKLEVKDDS